jgi:hypothetical protein
MLTLSICGLFALSSFASSSAVYVKKIDLTNLSLEDSWKQALSSKDEKIGSDSFWVVYTIEKLMSEGSNIRMCDCDEENVDLEFILFGKHSVEFKNNNGNGMRVVMDKSQVQLINGKKEIKVKKKLALLFHTDRNGRIMEVNLASMDSKLCFKGSSIIWMGEFGDLESLSFLKKIYKDVSSEKIKEGIIAAIANHQTTSEIIPFLKDIIKQTDHESLRTSTIFWFGTCTDEKNLDYLEDLALNDQNEKAREQAVFAIYISKTDSNIDSLIKVAKKSNDMEIKKHAVFWLGQSKADRIAETLSDIIQDDSEVELQKSAVFALSQHHSDSSIQKLISIARTHKNKNVRREAIFWLGQMDDEKAMDAIIKFAEED